MFQRLQHCGRWILAPKLVSVVVFALFVSLDTESLARHMAYASEELADEPLAEVSDVPEVPPPLTYEDVYAQWLTLESGLMRLADRLTLRTNNVKEAQSYALQAERLALRAQATLSSGNIDSASQLIAQTQGVLDSSQTALDQPLEDPSFIPIPAQQIFDASAPEQIALAFREKQNALNFFDQFERELMSSLSLSLSLSLFPGTRRRCSRTSACPPTSIALPGKAQCASLGARRRRSQRSSAGSYSGEEYPVATGLLSIGCVQPASNGDADCAT